MQNRLAVVLTKASRIHVDAARIVSSPGVRERIESKMPGRVFVPYFNYMPKNSDLPLSAFVGEPEAVAPACTPPTSWLPFCAFTRA